MMKITQDMVDCWSTNYGLDTRSPEEAARFWDESIYGMAPAGAVAALGMLIQERQAMRNDAERYRYLRNRVPDEVLGQVKSSAGCWIDGEDEEGVLMLLTGDDADAAIDAAMAAPTALGAA